MAVSRSPIFFVRRLPRWLMNLSLRLHSKPPASGLLYSFRGLASALHSSGFSEVHGYWAVPHPRFPSEYVPLEPPAVREARRHLRQRATANRSTRLLAALPMQLLPHLMPGLVFLASKP